MEADKKNCVYCGAKIDRNAVKCEFCGEWLSSAAKREEENRQIGSETYAPALDRSRNRVNPNSKASEFWIMFVWVVIGIVSTVFICRFILHITVPSEERMTDNIVEDAYDGLKSNTETIAGLFDDDNSLLTSLVFEYGYTQEEMAKSFYKYNQIVIDEHYCWSVGRIYNKNHPDGVVGSFGILGIVIPLVLWDDFSMSGEIYVPNNSKNEVYDYDAPAIDEDYQQHDSHENFSDDPIDACKVYKCVGKIGDYPVTVSLSFSEDIIAGSYYYDHRPNGVFTLKGRVKENGISMDEYTPDGFNSGHFELDLYFNGTFVNSKGQKFQVTLMN